MPDPRYRVQSQMRLLLCDPTGGISLAVCTLICVASLVVVVLMYGTPHGSINLLIYSAAGALLVTLMVKFLEDLPAGSVLFRVMRPLGVASYSMYLNEGFLIRLDAYIPFVMGPVLTLLFSFVLAVAWNRLVTDRATRWLKEREIMRRRSS